MTNKTHLIADESLGGASAGLLREYVETDRKASVGDYAFKDGRIRRVTGRYKSEVSAGINFDPYMEFPGDDETVGWADGYYKALEPTDVIQYEGARYKLVERKAEVGEKVVITLADSEFGDPQEEYVISLLGNVYTVEKISGNLIYTDGKWDDNSKLNLVVKEYNVLEPVESAPKQTPLVELTTASASEQVIAMFSSLSRKIVALEDEIDTLHRNNVKLAEELEAVKRWDDVDGMSSQGNVTEVDAVDFSGFIDAVVAKTVPKLAEFLNRGGVR